MTEEQLRDQTIPVRNFEEWLLRVMVREHDRRQCVMRGLQDSAPNEPWRICSPQDMRASRLRTLESAAKPGETVRQTVIRIESEQWERGKGKRK